MMAMLVTVSGFGNGNCEFWILTLEYIWGCLYLSIE